jgi:signal transduction histidine kinase
MSDSARNFAPHASEPAAPVPEALEQAERLARLGTLAAAAAHEINNPITYVLGNLEDLQRLLPAMREVLAAYRARVGAAEAEQIEAKLREVGGAELGDELIGDALEGALRIRTVVRDLLAIGRGEHGAGSPREWVDANDVLQSALRLMGRELGAAARVQTDLRATRRVPASRVRLGQVLLNLLANARDACAPADPERHRIAVRSFDAGERVVIEIQDSGPGIPAELREQLFLPFFTTKPQGAGTGLGLYVSESVVRELGGSLEFRDAPGGGTIFAVSLPAR